MNNDGTAAPRKTVTVTISVSTDSRTAHIGRYFVDVRDTTRPTQDPNGRQMTTRAASADGVRAFVGELADAARKAGVHLTVRDTTDEIGI